MIWSLSTRFATPSRAAPERFKVHVRYYAKPGKPVDMLTKFGGKSSCDRNPQNKATSFYNVRIEPKFCSFGFWISTRARDLKGLSRSYIGSIVIIALMLGIPTPPLSYAQTPRLGPDLDVNGWTVFTPSTDTHIAYVSNSNGIDTNDGRSERTAVKTIAKGVSLLRHGYPDWLLLKKGDTWTNEVFGWIRQSGRSAREPMLISSYGTGPRPLIKTRFNGAEPAIGSFGGAGRGGDFLALVGIEFYAHTRDPVSSDFITSGIGQNVNGSGAFFLNPSRWLLIEDCKFSFYTTNLVFEGGTAQYLALRRNIVVDAYSTNSHSSGLLANNVIISLIEENVFDHNGWNDSVSGAAATIFNHNIYLQGVAYDPKSVSGPAILKGNIVANASSHGAQLRAGGTVTNNLFVRNPLGLLILPPSTVNDNVFMSGNDITASLPRGFGIEVNPGTGPNQITNNILAHEDSSRPFGHGIILEAGTAQTVVRKNIIFQWDDPIDDKGIGNTTSPNDINVSGYRDPGRTVETYNVSLGGAPRLSDFLQEARKQSKDNWRPQYTANSVNKYIWAGFQR
jgi:hypothetical protein